MGLYFSMCSFITLYVIMQSIMKLSQTEVLNKTFPNYLLQQTSSCPVCVMLSVLTSVSLGLTQLLGKTPVRFPIEPFHHSPSLLLTRITSPSLNVRSPDCGDSQVYKATNSGKEKESKRLKHNNTAIGPRVVYIDKLTSIIVQLKESTNPE